MGIPNIPLCPPGARPLHVPPSPPGQTAGHSSLKPPPAPAADTARASQRLDFSPWRGTPQLLVPGINPGQLKQQEDKGAVPALRPRRPGCPATTLAGSWRSCSVTAPGPLRQESQASGLGRGGFFVPLRRRNDLSPSLSFSTWSCPVFHSQKFFSHFLTESRAGSEPSLPPDTFIPLPNSF